MKLLIATRNRHKLDEIRAILGGHGLELLAAADLPGLPDVVEDGLTFPANAAKKARELCDASGLWTLGDDSGLEVDALNGAPGVLSARYAGEHGDDAANNRKLLADLQDVTARGAQFRCAIALAAPDGRQWGVEGVCRGRVLTLPRGSGGFGYDPLFVPDGHELTFAELPGDAKNRISHRARALASARAAWATLLWDKPPVATPLVLPLLLLALLCGGCEIEASGGNDRAQWKLDSNLRESNERPNPDVDVVYADDDATVSVSP